jgi:hypothetical protein
MSFATCLLLVIEVAALQVLQMLFVPNISRWLTTEVEVLLLLSLVLVETSTLLCCENGERCCDSSVPAC